MKKIINGTVVAIIDDHTFKINVVRQKISQKYEKRFNVSKNYLVANPLKIKLTPGQSVCAQETRPLSSKKHFALTTGEKAKNSK